MAKEKDPESTVTDTSTKDEGTPPCTDPKTKESRIAEWFTLKIISRSGDTYYEVDSDKLGTPVPIGNDEILQGLKAMQVDAAHVRYGRVEPGPTTQVDGNRILECITKNLDMTRVEGASDEIKAAYCGTYFVNLHVFK